MHWSKADRFEKGFRVMIFAFNDIKYCMLNIQLHININTIKSYQKDITNSNQNTLSSQKKDL